MKKDKNYTYRSMRDEREYGLYWYSGLWHILRPVLVGLTVLVLVIGIGMTVWNKLYGSFLAPVDPADEAEYTFEIQSGQSLNRVASNLESADLIRSKTIFKYYCDFAGMAQKIQTGTYSLKKDMTMTEIADRLTTGDGNPLVRNITLIPGETVEEFAAKLVKNGVLEDDKAFLAACRDGKAFREYYYIDDVLTSGHPEERKYVLEGYLSPNTYEVYVTASAEEIIRKLLSQTEAAFPVELQDRAEELGLTMDQTLTLASLIEKEAKESDFARVSAVFHNRLKANMRLESDVTIHYITGIRKMALADSDLTVNSPYNTYQVNGLPVGPICNPSPAAIRAALYPDETMIAEKYLYFCAKEPESGELYFSKTLDQHRRAVEAYAPKWQQYDLDRGIK
ncbi:MAG: endolytic transglycosylase MltG [Clostridia bacterium]|nr:endolytic transglycosylase MltG [Clostridia bacterium]MBQ9402407.1 endolytic transglycosylase MltG [Clostridia bacterium]